MAGGGSFMIHLLIGFVLRLGFLLYGMIQDATMRVRFTDVDYRVFTGAAEFMAKGQSPYDMDTYRYTPILAWILQPNLYFQHWGCVLFILADLGCACLIYNILKKKQLVKTSAIFCAQLWLYNPLPMVVSSRGNAESIIAFMVLASLRLLMSDRTVWRILGMAVYGAVVHVKIYPITYALSIYLCINNDFAGTKTSHTSWFGDLLPTPRKIMYSSVAALTFAALTAVCYHWYGDEFLYETYFYHITRRDIKHNFSAYFYMLYLTIESSYSQLLGLAAFLPQLVLLVAISFKYYSDLSFCWFLLTIVFVTFNKVCTSQYFLWYLSLLPLILPSLSMRYKSTPFLLIMWFLSQGFLLFSCFLVEFEGQGVFMQVWSSNIIFLLVNVGIIYQIINSYEHSPTFFKGKVCGFPRYLRYYCGLLKLDSKKDK